MKTDNEKKRFKLFNMNRDGKGVYEEENRKPTLGFFFKLLWRKFPQIIRLNLMMLLQIIPIAAFIYVFFAGYKTPTATAIIYAPLYGISKILPSAGLSALLDIESIQMGIPVIHPIVQIVLIVLAVILAVTYGWINTGAAYILRGLFRGDPVFIVSDFFYAIKRNLKQSFFMGLLDFACTVVLIVDFIFFYSRTGSYFDDVMYFAIFAIAIIYIIMRFYIYQLLITFDLSIIKILKNSLIFTVLGIKRNIMAILGLILLIVIHIIIIILFLSIGISIPLILPAFYLLALIGFITTYAAYPIIDRYMIAPYVKENQNTDEEITENIEDSEDISSNN